MAPKSKEHKVTNPKDKCTPMFIVVLLTIAKTWKNPRYTMMH